MKKYPRSITTACILLVWFIKLFLRRYTLSFPYPIKFMLGIAPNFLDGFLLPFAAIWIREYFLQQLLCLNKS